MILLFDEEKKKFFQISDNVEMIEAPYVTLEEAAHRLGITKQGVTRMYGKKLQNMIKSIDGKRAIPVEELE